VRSKFETAAYYSAVCGILHLTHDMWGWFGGAGAQTRKDAPKQAILQLRQTLDMLQKRERHLENQMAEQDAVARKNISTNKTGKALPDGIARLTHCNPQSYHLGSEVA
jgi:hypothetical protein